MTVCTLDIGEDEEKLKKVHQILTDLTPQLISLSNGGIKFNFSCFETMGDPNSTRVVYGKMLEDENYFKLSAIIDLIISTLFKENILTEQNLSDNHIEYKDGKYQIKLHLTLLNVTFLNKILKKQHKKKRSKKHRRK